MLWMTLTTQLLLIETLDNKEALFNPPSYNSNSTLRLSSPDWADKIWLFRRFFHPRNSKPLYIRRPSVGGKVFARAWIFFHCQKIRSFVCDDESKITAAASFLHYCTTQVKFYFGNADWVKFHSFYSSLLSVVIIDSALYQCQVINVKLISYVFFWEQQQQENYSLLHNCSSCSHYSGM